jgi:hypothetical protein
MHALCAHVRKHLPACTLLGVQECAGGAGKGPVLLVKGLTEGQMATAEEALALIQQGQENRKVGLCKVFVVYNGGCGRPAGCVLACLPEQVCMQDKDSIMSTEFAPHRNCPEALKAVVLA